MYKMRQVRHRETCDKTRDGWGTVSTLDVESSMARWAKGGCGGMVGQQPRCRVGSGGGQWRWHRLGSGGGQWQWHRVGSSAGIGM